VKIITGLVPASNGGIFFKGNRMDSDLTECHWIFRSVLNFRDQESLAIARRVNRVGPAVLRLELLDGG